MFLTLTPMRRDDSLSLCRKGDVLSVNGTELDFSTLEEGAVLDRTSVPCDWLASDVTRIDGEIHLVLILPHCSIPWPAPEAALAVTHPDPLRLTFDGPVVLPRYVPEEGEP